MVPAATAVALAPLVCVACLCLVQQQRSDSFTINRCLIFIALRVYYSVLIYCCINKWCWHLGYSDTIDYSSSKDAAVVCLACFVR